MKINSLFFRATTAIAIGFILVLSYPKISIFFDRVLYLHGQSIDHGEVRKKHLSRITHLQEQTAYCQKTLG